MTFGKQKHVKAQPRNRVPISATPSMEKQPHIGPKPIPRAKNRIMSARFSSQLQCSASRHESQLETPSLETPSQKI